MNKFVTAVALVTGMALASAAAAQSSGSSSPASGPSSPPASSATSTDQSSSGQSSSSSSAPAPAPSSSSSQSQPSASAQTGVLVDAYSIIGATVRMQGRDVGKVERLLMDPKEGRVRTVVIQQGGLLGIGGKSVALPWESVKLGQDGDTIVVTAEQPLEQAPAASPRTDSKSDSSSKDKSDTKK